MSILIRGMEIPTSCQECAFRVDESETNVHEWICLINQYPTFYCKKSQSRAKDEEYLQDCPLVSVPPHGDLIDRDAIINALQELFDKRSRDAEFTGNRGACVTWNDAIYHIKSAQTVISAEEDE